MMQIRNKMVLARLTSPFLFLISLFLSSQGHAMNNPWEKSLQAQNFLDRYQAQITHQDINAGNDLAEESYNILEGLEQITTNPKLYDTLDKKLGLINRKFNEYKRFVHEIVLQGAQQGIELYRIYLPHLLKNYNLLDGLRKNPDQYDLSRISFTYQGIGNLISPNSTTYKYYYNQLIVPKK